MCRAQAAERRFDELRILVWWEGGWVEPLRRAMGALLAPIARELAAYAGEDPIDAADDLSAWLATGRARSATGSLIRRRLNGPDERVTMMFAMAQLVLGETPAWDVGPASEGREESVADVFERAAGIDRARRDALGTRGPWLESHDDVGDMLEPLHKADFFNMLEPHRVLFDASDDELAQARDDVRLIMRRLGAVARAVEHEHGRDAGGLGSLRALADDSIDVSWLVWEVRSLLIVRRVLGDERLDETRAQLDELFAQEGR